MEISILGLVSFIYILYQCFFSPLARFLGLFAAKLSKGWRAYSTARGHWHRELVALHRKYGNTVRIAPNELYSVTEHLSLFPVANFFFFLKNNRSIGNKDAFRTIYSILALREHE